MKDQQQTVGSKALLPAATVSCQGEGSAASKGALPAEGAGPGCVCPYPDAAECARIRRGGSLLTFRGWECECACHSEFKSAFWEDDDE